MIGRPGPGPRSRTAAWPLVLAAACVSACTISHDMRPIPDVEPVDTGVAPLDSPRTEAFPCDGRWRGDGAGVRWIGPDREGDRRSLAAWCSAVGPPVLTAVPARELPPIADHLTVVTWNVKVGGGDIEGFLRDELGYECGATGSQGFREHFVLLVQEAYRASDEVPVVPEGAPVAGRIVEHPPVGQRADIVSVARQCGLAHFYVPSMRNGSEAGDDGREDRGSAILSTLPLADPVAVELPLEAQRRVTLIATIEGPGGDSVRLANVHLDVAGNILRVLGTGGAMRVRQAQGLSEAVELLDPAGRTPTVLAGDMNTWSARETVILRLLEEYPESPDPGSDATRGSWPVDHLFYRAAGGRVRLLEGSYVVVGDTHGSDHNPRLARFEN